MWVSVMNMYKATRDDAINYLRGISIIYVVIHHSFTMPVTIELQWLVGLLQRITSEGTTLFILISGYLFYYLLNSYEYVDYLNKKTKNVLFPYLLVSIPAILIYVLSLKTNHNWLDMAQFTEFSTIVKIVYLYFTGAHLGPFWYVPVIILVFIISPLTVLMMKFVNPLILSFMCLIIAYLLPRPPGNSNVLMSYAHFYPIFLFGAVLYKCRAYWLAKINNTFVLSFLLIFYAFLILSSTLGFSIPPFLDKIIVFIVLYYLLQKSNGLSDFIFLKRLLDILAVYSFPIYFIHGYFIALTRMLWGETIWSNLIEYMFFGLSVFCITLIASVFCISAISILFGKNSNKIIGLNYKEYLKISPILSLSYGVKNVD